MIALTDLARWTGRVYGVRMEARALFAGQSFESEAAPRVRAHILVEELKRASDLTQAQRKVLQGIVWASVTERFEVQDAKKKDRLPWERWVARRASSRAQFGLAHAAHLSLEERQTVKQMAFATGGRDFVGYLVGAFAVSRVDLAFKDLPWNFRHAHEEEDVRRGIDAWGYQRKSGLLVPLQIKGRFRGRESEVQPMEPPLFLVGNEKDPREYTWRYLNRIGLPSRIFDIRVGLQEGGDIINFEESDSLRTALERQLSEFAA